MKKTLFTAAILLCLVLLVIQPAARNAVGDTAPEIQAGEWLNTPPLTLAALRGKVVILEFWATWCPPCRTSIPHLIALSKSYTDKPVTFISLTREDKSTVQQFMDNDPALKMPYALACSSSSSAAYGVRGIPHAFVIGKDGKILWRGHPMSGQFKPAIDRALAGRDDTNSTEPGDGSDGDD